jgi:hypothetical protein
MSSSPVNQAYFAMPVASCLTYDLVESIEDDKHISLENVLKMYTSDLTAGGSAISNQEQFDHL